MSIVLVGSTSGSCTLQEQAVAGTTVLTLPTVSGTILTTTSPKAGNVIQVVYAQTTTRTVGNSTSYVDISGLTASITPSSSSSKILVLVNYSLGTANSVDGGESPCSVNLIRASTQVYEITRAIDLRAAVYGGESNMYFSGGFTYLDSPATTSSTAYKCQVKQNLAFNRSYDVSAGSSPSSITLLEIAA
jgi:hypothetical protein